MRTGIGKRLSAIEERETDWISQLKFIDYVGIDDYKNGDWEEVFFDNTVTVFKHNKSGEVRGAYLERRTDKEVRAAGGDPCFL